MLRDRRYSKDMEVTPLGDSALLVRLRNNFEEAPEESLAAVLDATQRLTAAALSGVLELAPAYTTVAVFFDLLRVVEGGTPREAVIAWLTERIEKTLHDRSKQKLRTSKPRLVEVPVCYDSDFALDLEEIAQRAKLPAVDVVRLHTAREYRVHCLGFTPGFPYLSGLDAKLTTPRRATPRKEIPPGSVAIGGTQTGIYPLRSPGGWNVIGRTPLCMFDVRRDSPALLRAGDRVRFHSITRAEFDSLGK